MSESDAGVREGDVLAGKYRVERVLGVGGMGVVVAAHHLQLDQKVALKFLLPAALVNGDAVARFERESRAAAKIRSEHVARVIDVGQLDNGAPYMVMEYLEGDDLSAWVRRVGPLPVEQAAEFLLQAGEAIAEAHALGIVHRDLKPANLFCIRQPHGALSIKVLDFGVSKMMSGGSSAPEMAMTKTTSIMGSPLYMPPEQLQSSKNVDARADIWALGVILFELVTGDVPFIADTMPELCVKIMMQPPRSARELRGDIPPGLERVISRCLEKDRERRYANVAELAADLVPMAPPRSALSLERIANVLGVSPRASFAASVREQAAETKLAGAVQPEGTMAPLGRTGNTPKSANRVVPIVAGVLLVGVAATAAVWLLRSPSGAPPSPAPLAAEPPAHQAELPSPPSTTQGPTPPAAILPALHPVKIAPDEPESAAAKAEATLPAPHTATVQAVHAAPPPPAHASEPHPKGAPPAAAPAQPSDNKCDPPFFYDANGVRTFKKECL